MPEELKQFLVTYIYTDIILAFNEQDAYNQVDPELAPGVTCEVEVQQI